MLNNAFTNEINNRRSLLSSALDTTVQSSQGWNMLKWNLQTIGIKMDNFTDVFECTERKTNFLKMAKQWRGGRPWKFGWSSSQLKNMRCLCICVEKYFSVISNVITRNWNFFFLIYDLTGLRQYYYFILFKYSITYN